VFKHDKISFIFKQILKHQLYTHRMSAMREICRQTCIMMRQAHQDNHATSKRAPEPGHHPTGQFAKLVHWTPTKNQAHNIWVLATADHQRKHGKVETHVLFMAGLKLYEKN